jgi:hypothetical protein
MKKKGKILPNIQLISILIIMLVAFLYCSRSELKKFNVSITHLPEVVYAATEGTYFDPDSSPEGAHAYTQNLTWLFHLVFESHEDKPLKIEEVEVLFNREGEVQWKETYSRRYLERMEWIEGAFEMTEEYFIHKVEVEHIRMSSVEKVAKPDLPSEKAVSWVRIGFARPWFARIDRIDFEFKISDDQGNEGKLFHTVPINNFQHKVKLRLPFSGVWRVSLGNDLSTGHRRMGLCGVTAYCLAFLKVDKDGMPYKNDGKKPEDHYCVGEPIYAAGDGVVVDVRNDIVELPIGAPFPLDEIKKDSDVWAGNFVTMDHGDSVYSLTCHLQQGSIPVKIGDKVETGQFLGRVGHSWSSLPHLSFLLVTNKEWLEGKGLPVLFSNFERIGPEVPVKKIKLGNPITGWLVRPIE